MRCWVSVLSVVRFVLRKMIINLLMFISLKQKTMSMCVKIVKKIVGFVIFVQSAIHVSDLLMSLLVCGYQKMKLYGFAKTLLIRLMNQCSKCGWYCYEGVLSEDGLCPDCEYDRIEEERI